MFDVILFIDGAIVKVEIFFFFEGWPRHVMSQSYYENCDA